LAILAELESKLPDSTVLAVQRQALLRQDTPADLQTGAVRTAWEQWALGRLLLQSGKTDEAAKLLARAVEEQPEAFWPNFHLGVAAFQMRDFDRAYESFRVCTALAPRSAECFCNLGRAEAERGNSDAALRAFERALKINPHLAAAWLSRGLIHFQQDDLDAAAADLQRAMEKGADRCIVEYNLALVHMARGDVAAAREAVTRALQANPQHDMARRLQARLDAER
jgi:superkiller protein 3